jgi:hypothetical protein
MADEDNFSWTLPARYERDDEASHAPRHDHVGMLSKRDTQKLVKWLTDTSTVDAGGRVDDSEGIWEMLDVPNVDCVGTEYGSYGSVHMRLRTLLDAYAFGDPVLVDKSYRCADWVADSASRKWSSMVPADANFWTMDTRCLSVQVMALRVLMAVFYYEARRPSDESDAVQFDAGRLELAERNFTAKWQWLMRLPWMENMYAQEVEEEWRLDAWHAVVHRRRPLVEAGGLAYIHAGVKYILDPEMFGSSCMFTVRYKDREHSMLAFLAMYASLVWFNRRGEDDNSARHFSLTRALRMTKGHLGNEPLPDLFSLMFAARPKSRAMWRHRMMPWDMDHAPRILNPPVKEADRPAINVLLQQADDAARAQGLDVEGITRYVSSLKEEGMHKLERHIHSDMDHWDLRWVSDVIKLYELCPNAPDLILYLLAIYRRDMVMAPVRALVAGRIHRDPKTIIDTFDGGLVLTRADAGLAARRASEAARARRREDRRLASRRRHDASAGQS